MKTVLITTPPSAAMMYLRALRTSAKRPGTVTALPPVTCVRPRVVLDAAHIARYAALCGFAPEAGVPLVYPQLLTFPLIMQYLVSADCPWPASGTVHLANNIEQKEALRAGDTVRVEMETGSLYAHEKGQVFTLELAILRDGLPVWRATQTLMRVGIRNPAGPPYTKALDTDTPLSRQADLRAPADIGRRYGRLSGDLNPIHLSALSARLFGFRRAIAHGMWTKARAVALLLPATPVADAAVTVEFKTPLLLPARATLWTAHRERAVRFEVRDAQGEKPHLRGQLRY